MLLSEAKDIRHPGVRVWPWLSGKLDFKWLSFSPKKASSRMKCMHVHVCICAGVCGNGEESIAPDMPCMHLTRVRVCVVMEVKAPLTVSKCQEGREWRNLYLD